MSLLDTFKNTTMFDNIKSMAFTSTNDRPTTSNNYSNFSPQIPKRTRVYALSNPDMFVLQDLVDENKPVVLIERKDNAPGKLVTKRKSILLLNNSNSLSFYEALTEVKSMMRGFSGSVDGYGIVGIIKLPIGKIIQRKLILIEFRKLLNCHYRMQISC